MSTLKDTLINSAASLSGDIPANLDQSRLISSSCMPMALACGFAGLTVGIILVVGFTFKCKRDKADLRRKIESLNNELQRKEEEQDDAAQVFTTLTEQKRELENQRDQLKGQLEEDERKWEENKKKLQSVEREITERDMTFDKPEALLKDKENLLREQWELDQSKKIYESQLLNIEKLLETLEILVTRMINRKRQTAVWLG